MSTQTSPAPSPESEAAVRSVLAMLVAEHEEREGAAPSPAREKSVIDRARETLIARQASTS
jgi:hypothetical protein